VTVKPYGIDPNRFNVRMNTNKLKIKGKYFSPLPCVLVLSVSRTKLYIISAIDCIFPGTNFEVLKDNIKKDDISNNASTINNEEFVKLRSYSPNFIGTKFISLN